MKMTNLRKTASETVLERASDPKLAQIDLLKAWVMKKRRSETETSSPNLLVLICPREQAEVLCSTFDGCSIEPT